MTREEFGLHAEIDGLYYALKLLQEKAGKRLTPLETMIDNATGFGDRQNWLLRKRAMEIIRMVIRRKKKLGADTSGDEKFLAELKKLKIGG